MSRAVQALPAGVLVALCGVIVINLLWPREQERERSEPVPPATVYEVLEHREGCEVLEEVEGADRARYFLVTPLEGLPGQVTRMCRDLDGDCGHQVKGDRLVIIGGNVMEPPHWGKWGAWGLPFETPFNDMTGWCQDASLVPRSHSSEGLVFDLQSAPCPLAMVAKKSLNKIDNAAIYAYRVDTYDDDGQAHCQKHVELQLREVHLGGVLP